MQRFEETSLISPVGFFDGVCGENTTRVLFHYFIKERLLLLWLFSGTSNALREPISVRCAKSIRRRWDFNPRRETPMDQQSIALTTRPPRLDRTYNRRVNLIPPTYWPGNVCAMFNVVVVDTSIFAIHIMLGVKNHRHFEKQILAKC